MAYWERPSNHKERQSLRGSRTWAICTSWEIKMHLISMRMKMNADNAQRSSPPDLWLLYQKKKHPNIPYSQTGEDININRWEQLQSGHGGRWQKSEQLVTFRQDHHHPPWFYGYRHQSLTIEFTWYSGIGLYLKIHRQKFWLTAIIYGCWHDNV